VTPRDTDLRVLILNLAVDDSDPLLAFGNNWIRALAARSGSVEVITMREGPHTLGTDGVTVWSLGGERTSNHLVRACRFYLLLVRALSRRPDVVFSHMNPLLLGLAGPFLWIRRVPSILWYAHPSLTIRLRIAHFFASKVVTSLPNSYPYKKDKVAVIGQGIDTELFSPGVPAPTQGPPVILCISRLGPVKDQETLVRATRLLVDRMGPCFKVILRGSTPTDESLRYKEHLKTLVEDLHLTEAVVILPSVPHEALPLQYRECVIHVNLTPEGFGDKVAWESMACGTITLVANPDFVETLSPFQDQLLFEHGDAQSLADRLAYFLAMPGPERDRIGLHLRNQVIESHSLDALASKLIETLSSVPN
jgi:glycosyltransferase involved in cell wall biosynthesis